MTEQKNRTLERPAVTIDRAPAGTPLTEAAPPKKGPLTRDRAGAAGAGLGEFEAIFEHAPVAMILVDPDRVVCRMNRAATVLAGSEAAALIGQLPGIVLCCPNEPDAPGGCGTGQPCADCPLRQLIERSFKTRKPIHQVEALAPFVQGQRVEQRKLRISSSWLTIADRERTLLCIEDITWRALPSGAPMLPGK